MRKTIPLIAAALLACSPTAPDMRWAIPENITYASSLNVRLDEMQKNASGLYWQDVEDGSGLQATIDSEVRLHMTWWLPDATMFFTTRDEENRPRGPWPVAVFTPEGLAEGVIGMRPGGKRRLVVPPSLAWGRQGLAGLVPPMSTVIFLVERCNDTGPC
jgi:FKBP-type peptidyl-prolyl cis-trans isomerase FkpA